MRKILLFFIFILIFGCESILNKGNEIAIIKCPKVFFSSESNVYAQGDIDSLDLEKIAYKAKLNNYELFLIKPIFSNLPDTDFILLATLIIFLKSMLLIFAAIIDIKTFFNCILPIKFSSKLYNFFL